MHFSCDGLLCYLMCSCNKYCCQNILFCCCCCNFVLLLSQSLLSIVLRTLRNIFQRSGFQDYLILHQSLKASVCHTFHVPLHLCGDAVLLFESDCATLELLSLLTTCRNEASTVCLISLILSSVTFSGTIFSGNLIVCFISN